MVESIRRAKCRAWCPACWHTVNCTVILNVDSSRRKELTMVYIHSLSAKQPDLASSEKLQHGGLINGVWSSATHSGHTSSLPWVWASDWYCQRQIRSFWRKSGFKWHICYKPLEQMRQGKCGDVGTENIHPCRMGNPGPAVRWPSVTAVFSDPWDTLSLAHVYQIPTVCQDMKPGSTSCQLCGLEQFSNLHLPCLCNCNNPTPKRLLWVLQLLSVKFLTVSET